MECGVKKILNVGKGWEKHVVKREYMGGDNQFSSTPYIGLIHFLKWLTEKPKTKLTSRLLLPSAAT